MAWPMPRIERPRICPPSALRMHHRADVGVSEEIEDAILAGLDVHFDFGEGGDERKRVAVVRILVLGYREQTLARKAVAEATVNLLMSGAVRGRRRLPPSWMAR